MIIADTNEFHPLVNGLAYRDAKEKDGTLHPIVIMRATYSTGHVDTQYASSLVQARKANLLTGHYGYMVASASAHDQGLFFGNTVKAHGGIKPGDTIWCDDEEGTGDQSQRARDFLAAAHNVLHENTSDEGVYSGAAFWAAHLGKLPSSIALRWVAAYGQPSAPSIQGEDLWQFTDHQVMAGVSGPCDASIFNGSLEDFKKMVEPPVSKSGPHRHSVSHVRYSIDQVAAELKTTVEAIAAVTRLHVDAPHSAIFADYMALRSALRAIGHPSPVMPVGFVYYTSGS